MPVFHRNWKDITNENIKYADQHITATKMVEEQTDGILKKLTTDLSSEFEKVSGILQDNSLNLQQQKEDLEHHLAMVSTKESTTPFQIIHQPNNLVQHLHSHSHD